MDYQKILKDEGFKNVYTWHDDSGTKYPKHSHKDKVTIIITSGSVTFYFSDGSTKKISKNERFDVPVNTEHEAIVGPEGCDYVVGEMIEGDS